MYLSVKCRFNYKVYTNPNHKVWLLFNKYNKIIYNYYLVKINLTLNLQCLALDNKLSFKPYIPNPAI